MFLREMPDRGRGRGGTAQSEGTRRAGRREPTACPLGPYQIPPSRTNQSPRHWPRRLGWGILERLQDENPRGELGVRDSIAWPRLPPPFSHHR